MPIVGIMGGAVASSRLIGERAKQVKHYQGCTNGNRRYIYIYIYIYMVRETTL